MKIFGGFFIVFVLISQSAVYAVQDIYQGKQFLESKNNSSKTIKFKDKLSSRLDFSCSMYFPSDNNFNDLYPFLYGVSLNYIHSIFKNLCLNAGTFFLYQNHESKTETYIFFNSYSIGLRNYFRIFDIVYPYIGFVMRLTWSGERDAYESRDFFAYGGDPFIGCSVEVHNSIDLFIQYNYTLSRVNDEKKTDISGHFISIGVVYKGEPLN